MNMKEEEQDEIILTEHVIEPKITKEEYNAGMKPLVMDAITNAVVALTLDISQQPIVDKTRKELTEAEEWHLKKKEKLTNKEPSSSSMTTDTPSSILES